MAPPLSEADTGWLAEPSWASVLRAYEPDDEGCLRLSEGQWIYVQYVGEGDNADWNYGTDDSGASAGWFPADAVAFHDGEEELSSAEEPEGPRMGLAAPTTNSPPAASTGSTQVRALPIKMPAGTMAEKIKADPADQTSGGQLSMLSGKAQREEARRLADLQAKPLDDGAKRAIAERRALSVERRVAAESDAAKRAGAQSELEAKLARRRAAADGEKADLASALASPLPQQTSADVTQMATATNALTAPSIPAPVAAGAVAPHAGAGAADPAVVAEPAAELPAPCLSTATATTTALTLRGQASPSKEASVDVVSGDTIGVREEPTKSDQPSCSCCSMM